MVLMAYSNARAAAVPKDLRNFAGSTARNAAQAGTKSDIAGAADGNSTDHQDSK
jgi:hypothetical protein